MTSVDAGTAPGYTPSPRKSASRVEAGGDPVHPGYVPSTVVRLIQRLVIVTIVLVVLFAVARWLRLHYGVECEAESIRRFVDGLGPSAPIIFVFLIAFRAFFLMPSQLALVIAGICFGAGLGAIVGGAGLLGSGLMSFGIARYTGQQAIEARFDERFHRILALASGRGGAAFVGMLSSYPPFPLTPTQMAAGLTRMSWLAFSVSALCGCTVRSATFTFFGAALLEDTRTALITGGAVAVLLLLPLAHPRARAWIREALRPPDPAAPKDDPGN